MKKMKLSIIVCAYNEQDSIKKCIEELLDQVINHHNIEIIIIDNDSKDQTYHIALDCIKNSLFKNITLFSIKHCPLTGSRNFGLNVAKGDYVAYIDADGYVMKGWLSIVLSKIEKGFDLLSGSVAISQKSNFFSRGIFYSHFLPSLESAKPKMIIGANMIFERSKLISINGFQNTISGRGDETLLMHILTKNYQSLKILNDMSLKVVNSYPDKIETWLKQQIQEGKSGYYQEIENGVLIRLAKFIIKISSPIFILLFLLDFFISIHIYLYYFLFSLFLIRQLPKTKYYINSFKIGFSNLSYNYILFIPIIVIGSVFLDLGYCLGIFNRNVKDYSRAIPGKIIKSYPEIH